MPALPTTRTTANTADEHVADHNTLHAFNNAGGAPLAFTSYKPGTDTTTTTTSTTLADVDATNAVLTFTVPSSGAVIIRMSGVIITGASTNQGYWGLRQGTTDVANSEVWMSDDHTRPRRIQYLQKITGLTSGDALTWKWAQRCSAGSTILRYGPTYGPIVMEAWAA